MIFMHLYLQFNIVSSFSVDFILKSSFRFIAKLRVVGRVVGRVPIYSPYTHIFPYYQYPTLQSTVVFFLTTVGPKLTHL